VVRKEGQRLRVTKDGTTLLDLPLIHLDQLALMGNVQLTAQAVAMLLQADVDVVFLSSRGRFRGRLMHTGSKFAELRHAQLRQMSDERVALSIARQVVTGKLINQRVVLQRRAAQGPPEARRRVQVALSGMKQMLDKARRGGTLDSLRGYEGKAGAYYFDAFKALLAQDLGFSGRAYHPPPDPVNALLSFGYSLLLRDITASVQLVGLDPYLGFFHAIHHGRPSLSLDVMEEFRPIIVDSMALDLINNHRITEQDFVRTGQTKRPIHLSDGAVQAVIAAYEGRLETQVYHPLARGQTSYRRCLELQVRRLARVVLGKAKQYVPVTIK
jgi:CRISPR-associated protein Cas1